MKKANCQFFNLHFFVFSSQDGQAQVALGQGHARAHEDQPLGTQQCDISVARV
jgi:hypothetical protein